MTGEADVVRDETRTVELVRHPASAGDAARVVRVTLRCDGGDAIHLRYSLDGDLGRLRLPPAAPPNRVDELWRHTCFEAFVAFDGATAYAEFNFSPSGEWAAYSFRRYREREPLDPAVPAPAIAARTGPQSLELDAHIHPARALAPHRGAPLRVGLAAVVEERDGALSYWALSHPLPRPDFHHRDTFALVLDAGVDSTADPR